MDEGVTVDFVDGAGNTPLHYAAKYGHHDLCRLLVGKNAFPGKRNEKGETPYDVSENHTVRQYLLPLQFQCERNPPGHGSTDSGDNISMASVQISNASHSSNNNQTQIPYSQIPYSNNLAHNQSPAPYDTSLQLSPTLIPNSLTVHPYVHVATPQHTSPSKYQGVPTSIFPDERREESRILGNYQGGQGHGRGRGEHNPVNENNSIEQTPVPIVTPLIRSNSIPAVSNIMANIVPPSAASMSRSGPVILNQNPSTPIFNASTSSMSQPQRPLNVNSSDQNVEKVTTYVVNQKNMNSSTEATTGSGLIVGLPNNIPPPGHVIGPSPSIGPPAQSVYRSSSSGPLSGNHRIFQPGMIFYGKR